LKSNHEEKKKKKKLVLMVSNEITNEGTEQEKDPHKVPLQHQLPDYQMLSLLLQILIA